MEPLQGDGARIGNTMKLTRRQMLGGIAVVGASAGVGAGTFAYLNDESTADVTINVGNLELSEPAPIEWSEDPTTPQEDTFSDSLTIENTGNLPSRQVLLTEISVNDTTLAKALKILDIRYGQDDPESILEDVESNENGNGIYDLDDLRQSLDNSDIALEDLAGNGVLYAGDSAVLEIDAQFDYSKIEPEKGGNPLDAVLTISGRQEDPDDEQSTETPEE